MIPLAVPCLSGPVLERLRECIETNFVSTVGPFVDELERRFADWVGARYAVACASGTAAIHLALLACGVRPGDLVLCSDFTFIASANPVRYCGAEVGFVDSDRRHWNMHVGLLEEALAELAAEGALPRALVLVHVLGVPADVASVMALCQKYGVVLIEDAAESLGARMADGRMTGTIGKAGCFSFNGNKLITTGGGGMVVTDDENLARHVRHLSTQAKRPGLGYEHDDVGFNYRLTNVAAAMGVAQLDVVDSFLANKQAIERRYRDALAPLGFEFPTPLASSTSSAWLSSMLCPVPRAALIDSLIAQGITVRPVWSPLSRQAPYAQSRHWRNGVADDLGARGLSLPCSVDLSPEDQARVIDAVRAHVEEAG